VRRWALVALAVLGAGLAAAPLLFGMFDRAPKGADMIDGFKPYMSEDRLEGYERHIGDIRAAVREGQGPIAETLGGASFEREQPTFAAFAQEWPAIDDDMSQMLATIKDNVGNYEAVAALPDFALFPWFFVVPGVLLVLLAIVALVRPGAWPRLRWALAALGVGLVLAPAVFQMFTRAPKGAEMVNAFTTIETRANVERIQGYFGSIAVGQGAVRLELVPALERRLDASGDELAARFPASVALVERWPTILGDLTPMIGAMSDNVENYEAVAALPDFRMFPWFFVAPGLIALALVAAARPRAQGDPAPVLIPAQGAP
jgi:hypothetical protein